MLVKMAMISLASASRAVISESWIAQSSAKYSSQSWLCEAHCPRGTHRASALRAVHRLERHLRTLCCVICFLQETVQL
jgi:hypothetical protein